MHAYPSRQSPSVSHLSAQTPPSLSAMQNVDARPAASGQYLSQLCVQ
jgi:hypothetical protein